MAVLHMTKPLESYRTKAKEVLKQREEDKLQRVMRELRDADELKQNQKRWAKCAHTNTTTINHGRNEYCDDCDYQLR